MISTFLVLKDSNLVNKVLYEIESKHSVKVESVNEKEVEKSYVVRVGDNICIEGPIGNIISLRNEAYTFKKS